MGFSVVSLLSWDRGLASPRDRLADCALLGGAVGWLAGLPVPSPPADESMRVMGPVVLEPTTSRLRVAGRFQLFLNRFERIHQVAVAGLFAFGSACGVVS